VLIDGGLPEAKVAELPRQIKENWPEVGCLVLAESVDVHERALEAGADEVLAVGGPAGRMYAVLQGILGDLASADNGLWTIGVEQKANGGLGNRAHKRTGN
jgi:hypothetical protein